MRVKPGSTHTIWEEWGVSGVTLGVTLEDADGATATARTTGFVEDPAGSGNYRLTDYEFPDEGGDYRLIFDDTAGVYDPAHVSTRDVFVTSSAPDGDFDGDTFATVAELYPILNIRTPSEAQEAKAERVLLAAAGEIVRELDLSEEQELDGYGVALCAQVNLQRAAELWKEEETQFGILATATLDSGATYVAVDTWLKYVVKLSTLKGQWGFA